MWYYVCFFMIMRRLKIDSDDDLPLEETMNLYSVIIIIQSVFNKNENHCYYNTFLKKCSFQLA